MCSGVALAAFTSVELCGWSRGWALCSTAGGPAFASPVITGRKSLELLPRLNAALTSGSETAPTNRPCNRLSHPLPSALSRSSREIFPAPVTNQAVGDLSEL